MTLHKYLLRGWVGGKIKHWRRWTGVRTPLRSPTVNRMSYRCHLGLFSLLFINRYQVFRVTFCPTSHKRLVRGERWSERRRSVWDEDGRGGGGSSNSSLSLVDPLFVFNMGPVPTTSGLLPTTFGWRGSLSIEVSLYTVWGLFSNP